MGTARAGLYRKPAAIYRLMERPKPLSPAELAALERFQIKLENHPDPDVAMFLTAAERNAMWRAGEHILWAAEQDPAFANQIIDAAEKLGIC